MLKSAIPATLIMAACSMPAYAECDFFSLDSIMLTSSDDNCLDFSSSIESFWPTYDGDQWAER